MKNPSKEVIEAIVKLRNNREFAIFREWLKESKEEAYEQAVNANQDTSISIGRARELNETVNVIDGAVDALSKFKP